MTELEVVLIATSLSAIIGPIVVTRYRYYLDNRRKKKDPIGASIKLSNLVDDQLQEVALELDTCRVWVSQFHNGGNFYPTGTSIQKFSIFYEHARAGSISVREIFQNIPISLFAKPMNTIYESGELLIPDYKKDNSHGLRTQAEGTAAKSTYMFALYSLTDEFLGTLGVEYCKKKRKLSEEELNICRTSAITIGTLLSTYLYANDKHT